LHQPPDSSKRARQDLAAELHRTASNDYHDDFSPSNDFSPAMTSAQQAVNA
jgi:hypothetical protein